MYYFGQMQLVSLRWRSQFSRNALTKHSEYCSLSATYFPTLTLSSISLCFPWMRKDRMSGESVCGKKEGLTNWLSYFHKIYVLLFRRQLLSLFSHISWKSECWWTRRKPLQRDLKDRGGLEKMDAHFKQFSFFDSSRVFPKRYSVDLNKSSVQK